MILRLNILCYARAVSDVISAVETNRTRLVDSTFFEFNHASLRFVYFAEFLRDLTDVLRMWHRTVLTLCVVDVLLRCLHVTCDTSCVYQCKQVIPLQLIDVLFTSKVTSIRHES